MSEPVGEWTNAHRNVGHPELAVNEPEVVEADEELNFGDEDE